MIWLTCPRASPVIHTRGRPLPGITRHNTAETDPPGAEKCLIDTSRAPATRPASERGVSYLPIMNGPLERKDEKSKTPLYFHLKGLVGY